MQINILMTSEPWSYKNTDPDRMKAILFTISEQIKIFLYC